MKLLHNITYDRTNEILFRYNGGTPIGFVLNDVQYLYLTDLSGNVVGITDADGNLIARYTYDEWGKLLSIDAENEENRAVAEINPLRYRGYYYDNETGLYYLQSRYYNPDWCRFISADDFGYINTNKPLNINAYSYCINNPILFSDPNGNANVSEAGKAVGDFIGIMFLTLEAQARLGDDFAAVIAAYFTKNPSLIHYEYNPKLTKIENEQKKHQASENLLNWFDETAKDFEKFMKSSFYKFAKFLKDDFFFDSLRNL